MATSIQKFDQSPQIRFPEFTTPLHVQQVASLASITTGNKDTKNKISGGKYPFYVRSDTVERINSFSLVGPAVLTAGDGVGVGKVFHFETGAFDFHQRVYAIHQFADYINPRFFYHYFRAKFFERARKLSAKNSVDSVRMAMISEMDIVFPDLEEQSKIADFLDLVDLRLTLLNEQKSKFEIFRAGLREQILNQTVRFKNDEEAQFPDWRTDTLSSILTEDLEKGDDGATAEKLTVKLRGKGVTAKQAEGSANTQYYRRKSGQIIYSKLDFLNGAFGVIPEDLDGYQSTIDLPAFNVSPSALPGFVLATISRPGFYLKHGSRADGSRKAKRIHPEDFLSFPISLPSYEEQALICDALKEFDQRCILIEHEIDQLSQYMRGLQTRLFA